MTWHAQRTHINNKLANPRKSLDTDANTNWMKNRNNVPNERTKVGKSKISKLQQKQRTNHINNDKASGKCIQSHILHHSIGLFFCYEEWAWAIFVWLCCTQWTRLLIRVEDKMPKTKYTKHASTNKHMKWN